ncbi:polymorphic toxin type 15 domain-containing protein [Agrobacterium fabrum]|uniref:polymorphic toxin type 15 domain-containing protein n=1 Tax=Agrobacterium fabrum TaxID=1176649 RepID=UPI000EF4F27A
MCSWRQPCSRRALDHVRVMQEQGLNNMSPQQMLANQAKYSLHTDRQLSAHCYRL